MSDSRVRLLFVDDEKQVLDGLRNALRKERATWDMTFACGGEAGLAELRGGSFDVVVSDLRMPGVDGATLLATAKQLQPRAIRMVLSGQSDMDTAMRTVFVAHQFLAKPCAAEALRSAVTRAMALAGLIESDDLRAIVGGVGMLPAAPGSFSAISKVLANPNASLDDVARLIQRDAALAAKLLQLVNSAFFALPRRVANIGQAASYLGVNTIRDLALGVDALRMTAASSDGKALSHHTLLTAELARKMFPTDRTRGEKAFCAGLLHAVGLLVRESGGRDFPISQHGAVGAYLLNLWGLPQIIVEAVAFREHPTKAAHPQFEIVDAVHIADRIATDTAAPNACACPGTTLDSAHLSALGISEDKLSGWRSLAKQLGPTLEI